MATNKSLAAKNPLAAWNIGSGVIDIVAHRAPPFSTGK